MWPGWPPYVLQRRTCGTCASVVPKHPPLAACPWHASTLCPNRPLTAPPPHTHTEEFIAATINGSKLQREELLKAAFVKFDEDGNGQISRQELFNALSDPTLGIDPKEIDEIIDQVDQDGSGTIDFKVRTG